MRHLLCVLMFIVIPPIICAGESTEDCRVETGITMTYLPCTDIPIPVFSNRGTTVAGSYQRDEELEERWYELKLQTCPEVLYDTTARWSSEERITEHSALGVVTVNDRLRLSAGARRSFFVLNQKQADDEKVTLTTFSLGADWRLLPRLRLVSGLSAYTGRDARGVGADLACVWEVDDNLSLRLGGKIFQPWIDNTLAVDNDGRFHNLAASLNLRLTPRLSGTLDAGRWWYGVGERAPGGRARQAWRFDWGASLRYAIWHNPERVFGNGFLERSGEYEDSFSPGLFVYAACRRDTYHPRVRVPLVPVIAKSLDLRAGLAYNAALNRHWGLQAGAYAGHDTLREIPWRKLYGWNARLIFAPRGSVRVWCEYRMDGASGSAVANGREQTLAIGANFNF